MVKIKSFGKNDKNTKKRLALIASVKFFETICDVAHQREKWTLKRKNKTFRNSKTDNSHIYIKHYSYFDPFKNKMI